MMILQRFSAARPGLPGLYRNIRSSHFLSRSCFSSFNVHEQEDFFRYTSGRWLWDEQQQLLDRFTPFNVLELQRIAARSIGSNHCVAMMKLAEGSFNKTFRLVMDNGSAVIARIPHPIAGPKYYTTASEVATMDFASLLLSTARTVLQIPTPRVHAWNAHADDPVGAEYIIMEEAAGTNLEDVWDELPLEDKVSIMKDLVFIEKKLLSISFGSYGNLYYSDEAVSGAVAAEVMNDVSPEIKSEVKKRFSLGPVVERDFWSKERSIMNIDRGPWKHPQEYAVALARREQEWIQRYAVPRYADDPLVTSAAQNSPDAHLLLLQRYLQVAPYLLPADSDIIAPTIWHTDLHAGNLFVDKGRITGVIDWQGAWAGPLVLQGRHPRLVDYHGDIILKPPANFKDLEPNEKARLRKQIASSIILYLYEQKTAKVNPGLDGVFRLKLGRVRCEPISFVSDAWDDDILPLRESLINVERYWHELGFDFPCPIHFTEDELQQHARDGDGWNEAQDFWKAMEGIVTRDGWTSHEQYDDAMALFSELRENILKTLVGKERKDFEAQTRWAEKSSSSQRPK
ncbi:phosphotransferase enzyme family protein [Nannizzia gypsea CBS 118893]|uniref:Phosphotransferase enzyme family protein n=1 Tax=Arthroderma gypseum (strain ATCC MYA-4604 / CBS 118893) TaxID=535722 RepID=E5R405_ARTGP|nr:phosphotransferase enzyme family protein [Nannizzia gypsea CBS 118893]EFQ98851.1 phosphotransferase enzyme family protein [Nannizzia gypsea CBS 118893]